MANPQVENGHLKIANEIWEQLMLAGFLTGADLRILMCVIRCSWGWHRKACELSVADIATQTGLTDRIVSRSAKRLEQRNVLKMERGSGRGKLTKWTFNKDWESWLKGEQDGTLSDPIKGEQDGTLSTQKSAERVNEMVPFITIPFTLSGSKPLTGKEHEAPKAISKANKAKRAPKVALPPDLRNAPLKKAIEDRFREERGHKLISRREDWIQFAGLLRDTKDDPAFSLERLEAAWLTFLRSKDKFHVRQGHPLAFWASNINAFLTEVPADAKPKRSGGGSNFDAVREDLGLAAKGRGGG